MAATSRDAPYVGLWTSRARNVDNWLSQHKVVVSATSASLVSTFAGFPLDSLKSRLQSSRESIPLTRLAAEVVREEGIGGLWRGFPLPLITISIVRTISFTIYTSTKRIINSVPNAPLAIPAELGEAPANSGKGQSSYTPWVDIRLGLFTRDSALDVGMTSLLAGGASGAVVCFGSAPFELVKVRRQLEYQIFRDSNPALFSPIKHSVIPPPPALSSSASRAGPSSALRAPKPNPPPQQPAFHPPTTLQAVRLILAKSGFFGLYTGIRLHIIRDTLGTALYFAEYDVMRYYLGRKTATSNNDNSESGSSGRGGGGGLQGDVPGWAKGWLPKQVIPFLCGSLAGVTSWAMIYPVDAIKTKAQQRALSGLEPRTPLTQFLRLVRGPDKDNPKPLLTGIARLYRGLGVSMIRSMLTHGLLWTIVDWAGAWIDTKPFERLASNIEAR